RQLSHGMYNFQHEFPQYLWSHKLQFGMTRVAINRKLLPDRRSLLCSNSQRIFEMAQYLLLAIQFFCLKDLLRKLDRDRYKSRKLQLGDSKLRIADTAR